MGGALQACVSFIRQSLISNDGIDWHYAVSREIADELSRFDINIKDYNAIVVTPSPARSRKSRLELIRHIEDLNPGAVFTFFGPAYIRIPQAHIMGVADGWITHSSRMAIRTKTSIREKVRFFLLFLYKRHWYKSANRWIVEAPCAKDGMVKRFFVNQNCVSVVPNSSADIYLKNQHRIPKPGTDTIRLLTLSAYYKHKNLEIIPHVAAEIRRRAPLLRFEFIITLKQGPGLDGIMRKADRLGVTDCIRNIGPVAVVDGPDLYAAADIVFMPSILETFSAVYPEAMISGCPIVATDLDFARDICADAACYYSPLDPASAAIEILRVASSPELFQELVMKGRERFTNFPSQSEKYQLYVKELQKLDWKLD